MRLVAAFVLLFSLLSVDAWARGRVTRPPAVWGMPACDAFRVGASFWYTLDNTVANEQYTPIAAAPQDLAPSDVANVLFAIFDNRLYESPDAGCKWTSRGAIAGGSPRVIAAKEGRAYVWSDTTLLRVRRDRVENGMLPDRLLMLTADVDNADRLIALSSGGTAYASTDGGTTWQRRGAIGRTPLQAAAVDPFDFDHMIAAGTAELSETRDGGATWRTVDAPDRGTMSAIAFSSSSDVVWIGSESALYQSTDGGATFARLMRSSALIPFGQGVKIAAHPQETSIFAMTTLYGLAIVDTKTKTTRVTMTSVAPSAVVWSPNPRVLYVTTPQLSVHAY